MNIRVILGHHSNDHIKSIALLVDYDTRDEKEVIEEYLQAIEEPYLRPGLVYVKNFDIFGNPSVSDDRRYVVDREGSVSS